MTKKQKIIIGLIVVFSIIVIIISIILLNNTKSDNNKSNKNTEYWKKAYLEILQDKEKFDNLDNIELQLSDLNNDNIPEFIIFATKITKDDNDKDKQKIAKIYSVNEDGECNLKSFRNIDTIALMYNNENGTYGWYGIKDKENAYEFLIDRYIIDISDKVYKVNKDVEEFLTNYYIRLPFDNELENSEKKELFEKLKESFKTLDELVQPGTILGEYKFDDSKDKDNLKNKNDTFYVKIEKLENMLKSEYEHYVLDLTHFKAHVINENNEEIAQKIEEFLNEEVADYSIDDFQDILDSFGDTEDNINEERFKFTQTLELELRTDKFISVSYNLVGDLGGVPWISNLGYVISLETGEYYTDLNELVLDVEEFKEYIINKAKKELKNQLGEEGLIPDYENELSNQLFDDGHWYLTRNGMNFEIEKYAVSYGASGAPTISITYEELSGYLRDDILEAIEKSE